MQVAATTTRDSTRNSPVKPAQGFALCIANTRAGAGGVADSLARDVGISFAEAGVCYGCPALLTITYGAGMVPNDALPGCVEIFSFAAAAFCVRMR